jgi:hypothetical protein
LSLLGWDSSIARAGRLDLEVRGGLACCDWPEERV